MIKIAVTDDHNMIIEGLKTMFQSVAGYEICAGYNTIAETLQNIPNNKPDILLLDISLPDGNGSNATKQILQLLPELKIIALSSYDDHLIIRQTIQNGAKGFLLKNTSPKEIIKAIETALENNIYLSPILQEQFINADFGMGKTQGIIPKLTGREKEVLKLIVEEFTTDEIAKKLFVTPKAIEAHRSNLLQKLGVRNIAGLVKIAIEKGLI